MQEIKPGYPQTCRPKAVHEFRFSDKATSLWRLVLIDIRKKLDAQKNNGDEQCEPSKKSENGSNGTPNSAGTFTGKPSDAKTWSVATSNTSDG